MSKFIRTQDNREGYYVCGFRYVDRILFNSACDFM